MVKYIIALLRVTKFCSVGLFETCLNVDFLGSWSNRYLTVTKNIQPTIKEQLEAHIDQYKDNRLCCLSLAKITN